MIKTVEMVPTIEVIQTIQRNNESDRRPRCGHCGSTDRGGGDTRRLCTAKAWQAWWACVAAVAVAARTRWTGGESGEREGGRERERAARA